MRRLEAPFTDMRWRISEWFSNILSASALAYIVELDSVPKPSATMASKPIKLLKCACCADKYCVLPSSRAN